MKVKSEVVSSITMMILIFLKIDMKSFLEKNEWTHLIPYVNEIDKFLLFVISLMVGYFLEKIFRNKFLIEIEQKDLVNPEKREIYIYSRVLGQRARSVIVNIKIENSFAIFHWLLKRILKDKKIELIIKILKMDSEICYLKSNELDCISKEMLKKDITEKINQMLDCSEKTDNNFSYFLSSNVEKSQLVTSKTILVETKLDINLNKIEKVFFKILVRFKDEIFRFNVNFDGDGG